MHLRTWCSHNNGNPPGPEGCEWCEKRTPHHILRAAHAHALRELGLKLRLESEDYGHLYYGAEDAAGLDAGICISPIQGRFAPDFPFLTAPDEHPVWGLIRGYATGAGLDPTPWLLPGEVPSRD